MPGGVRAQEFGGLPMADAGKAAGCGLRAAALRTVILFAFLASIFVARDADAQIGSGRYAAFVQDANTGEVLLAINADEPRYPASLTKMMTLYLTFEALERGTITPNTRIRVSARAAQMQPSKLGLRAGSTIQVRDAILALVTRSANDVAVALGEHLSGSTEAAFGRMMTRKARALGMSSTTFRNASGLPDPAQVTTARDMAVLSRRLLQDFPNRYAYFSATDFRWNGNRVRSHNRLLTDYDGADGIKTGYIRASGFNIAASAMRDGRRLVAVVFGGASGAERDAHVMALLDRGFDDIRRNAPTDMMVAGRGSGLRVVGSANAAPVAPAVRSAIARPSATPTPSALPAPQPRARTGQSGWAVQVGAFSARESAQAAARRAAARGGKAQVERVQVNGRWLWRARVTGLSAADARKTCSATRGACMVLSPTAQ